MIASPETARADWKCPVARLWGEDRVNPFCRAEACPAWRWEALTTNAPEFKDVVRQAISGQFSDGKPQHHATAVRWVMDHREELGLPTRPTQGRCGLGGAIA